MNQSARSLRPVWHLLPSGYSVPFVALATAWLLLFGSCTGVMTVAEAAEGKMTTESLAGTALVFGFALLPVGAVLLFVGGLLAGRWAARAVLFALTALVLLAGLLLSLGAAAGQPDPVGGAVVFTILFTGPIVVVLAATLGSTFLAVRDVRAAVAEARRDRLRVLLRARGELDFDTVARELRLSPTGVGDYLGTLVRQQGLAAEVDPDAQMVFSAERYRQKVRDLVSVAWGRGKVTLPELGAELRLSTERLHALLVEAMQSGTFAGFLDARTGEVVSAASAALRHGRTCPACGGQMDLAGNGLIVCAYCRAEVFLSPAGAAAR